MQIINNPDKSDWSEILKRPTQTVDDIEATVNQIFDEVRQKGDEAIAKYTNYFDGITLHSNVVTSEEIQDFGDETAECDEHKNRQCFC